MSKDLTRAFRNKLQKLRGALFYDHGDYRNSIILAGSGRSGTTWVEEVLNYDNEYRVLFEPFHSRKIRLLREWRYRQYLPETETGEKFLRPAEAILSGQIRDGWIDRFNTRVLVRKRLIKDIRAHLILKWIRRNFPEIPIILLLRHPCAVTSSKLKLDWETHLEDFLGQDELMRDHLGPFKTQIESAADAFDQHIFMWCIENYVPLRQFSDGGLLVVFYEELCLNPAPEIERLFSHVGKVPSPEAVQALARPSALSRKDSAIQSGADLIGSWRRSISAQHVKRAVEILELFGLDSLYGADPAPRVSGRDALHAFQAAQPGISR